MTKQKLYIIRKIGFEYGDDWYYNLGNVEYYGCYNDLETAQNELEKAENEIYRHYYIIQFLFGDNGNDTKKRVDDLDEYVQKHFNISLKTGERNWDYYDEFKIPANATDNQVEEIREIIQIPFHKIVELEKENISKFVISSPSFKDSHINQGEYGNPILSKFFETENEAFAAIINYYGFGKEQNSPIGFKGNSIEELSDLPDLLKSYLDSCSSWELMSSNSSGYLRVIMTNLGKNFIDEFKGLLPLLKTQILNVIQI